MLLSPTICGTLKLAMKCCGAQQNKRKATETSCINNVWANFVMSITTIGQDQVSKAHNTDYFIIIGA
jgi:hypothetical protein